MMYWMRHIALLLSVLICLIGIDTERYTVAASVSRSAQHNDRHEAAFVLHTYSDLALTERVEYNATSSVRMLQRIPVGKSSSRLVSGRNDDHTTHHTPIFYPYGGHYRLPAATTTRPMTELSRLCRLII